MNYGLNSKMPGKAHDALVPHRSSPPKWVGKAHGRSRARLRELLAELNGQRTKFERREACWPRQAPPIAAGPRVRRLDAWRTASASATWPISFGKRRGTEWRRRAAQRGRSPARRSRRSHRRHRRSLARPRPESDLKDDPRRRHRSGHLEKEIAEKSGQAGARLEQLFERRGPVREQLKSLAGDTPPGRKASRAGHRRDAAGTGDRRWRMWPMLEVLETVREIYERERQPAALREASTYLALTGGRYRRVWTPLGHRVLRVDDAGGCCPSKCSAAARESNCSSACGWRSFGLMPSRASVCRWCWTTCW